MSVNASSVATSTAAGTSSGPPTISLVHRITESARGSPEATPSTNGSEVRAAVLGGAPVAVGAPAVVAPAVVAPAPVVVPAVVGSPTPAGSAAAGAAASSGDEQPPRATAAERARNVRRDSRLAAGCSGIGGGSIDADARTPSVSAMAVLHAERFGTRGTPKLLAVHGVTGHGGRWEHLAGGPLATHDVLAVDLRGHGHSPAGGPWSIEQHVADLVDTLDDAGWEGPVDVVGHSFGGAIATFLLALEPRRIRRLVLLDPALHLDGDEALAAASGAIGFGGFASPHEAAATRRSTLDPSGHWAIEGEVETHLVEGDDGRYRWRFAVAPVAAAWGEMARTTPTIPLRRPTLLVIATKAEIVTEAYLGALRAELGAALTVTELDCGHMLYWERPTETAALIERFL